MSKKRPRSLGTLLVVVLMGVLLIWWGSALTNEDPLWFLPSFSAEADWIVVYWDGTTHIYFPGDQAYEGIMRRFSAAIVHSSGYEAEVGWSEEDLERCRQQERLLELHYNNPVQVHTRHRFPEAHYFYVPLSGIHSESRRIFAGYSAEPRSGALNINERDFSSLLETTRKAAQ